MLDAFEARLADLFADRLVGVPDLLAPQRGLPAAAPDSGILPVLRVTGVSAAPLLGDDAPQLRRLPGGLGLRTVLELRGVVAMDLVPAAAITRDAWLRALDALLVAFQAGDVRSGAAFADGSDQGFALRGFRFSDAAQQEDAPGRLRATFAFEGDFWPVRPEEEGPAIAAIPARLVSLPPGVPDDLVARAGGPDLLIPVALDLRALGAGPPRVVARLRGATPPGSLPGDPAGAPPGFTGFPVDAEGIARIVFRPPATLAAPAHAGIQVALAGAGRSTVPLAEIVVRVLP
ncbi:hypothetical protein [Neoroseomonas soli]|uniref:Uncharacterized protein n=1 Tax=Neoroseomonas soli TaxID=1081025 RepID=A0A9X9X3U4_9PROT|nr:hypothetical protein [Neoroseomonas soli]MBR0674073.1 hypothetical protein [Neoroseomonas soli]